MPNKGDIGNFRKNWKIQQHSLNNWFYRGKPKNQIEYAFGQHWSFLRDVVKVPQQGKCLEVGCGRGSLSAFFAEIGYQVTLVDLSQEVMTNTKKIFKKLKLDQHAEFYVLDANALNFQDSLFDLIISVGLLEHFENPQNIIAEQVRVLKKGGIFTAYVVPEKWSVQNIFQPVNSMLSKMRNIFAPGVRLKRKAPLFRTTFDISYYVDILRNLKLKKIGACGVYPYPAISFSPVFPFTLMPSYFEKMLVRVFQQFDEYKVKKGHHPWVCEESWGQGFYIWGQKP